MQTAFEKAIELMITADPELLNILGVTAKMSLSSSLIALLLGVPLGLLLGAASFRGRGLLVVLNRTLMGMPPVVCGLIFYLFFSGVGPFRGAELLFTVEIMIIAQVVLITPIVAGSMETYASSVAPAVRENACGLGLGKGKTFALLLNECVYQVFSAYLLAFARAIAEVGAVSMVGGAIAWKTNVMTTAIMEYTNKGNFSKVAAAKEIEQMKISAFTKTYGGRTVLDMPETELEHGASYAVIGANGSGKSTLARILAGVEKPDGGKTVISGITVGYMPQKSYAFRMTVMRNLLVGANDEERARYLMRKLGIEHLASEPAHKLSGGETARMALARLLMRDRQLLIVDEPTAAMDMESVTLTERLLAEYREKTGCTLLLVTHSLRQAERLTEKTLFFDFGKLVEFGPTQQIITQPSCEQTRRFIELYGS